MASHSTLLLPGGFFAFIWPPCKYWEPWMYRDPCGSSGIELFCGFWGLQWMRPPLWSDVRCFPTGLLHFQIQGPLQILPCSAILLLPCLACTSACWSMIALAVSFGYWSLLFSTCWAARSLGIFPYCFWSRFRISNYACHLSMAPFFIPTSFALADANADAVSVLASECVFNSSLYSAELCMKWCRNSSPLWDLMICQPCLNLLMYSNTSSLSLCLVHSNCNSASVTVAIRYVSFSGTFIASHRCLGSAMGSFGVSFSKIFVFFHALPWFCAHFAFLLEHRVYSISCFFVLVLFLPQWFAPFLLAVSVFCLAEGSQSQNLWDSGALRPYLFNSHSCFWCAGYSDLLLSDLFSGSSLIGPLLFSLLSHQNKG